MNSYESYKFSDIDWIGKIPSHWETVKPKYKLNRVTRSIDDDDEVVTCFRDGVVTLRKNRREDGFTTSLQEHGYQQIRPGDLVIHEMDGFAGAIGISDSKGKSTPVYTVIQPDDQTNLKYVAYLLKEMSQSGKIESLAKSIRERTTEFRWNMWSVTHFPFPPVEEQNLISRYLDKKTAQVDSLIEKIQKIVELLKEKRLKLIEDILLNPDTKRIRLKHVVNLVKRPIQREENKTFTKIGMYNWGKGIFKYPSEKGSELGDSSFNYLKEGDLLLSGQFSWEGSVSVVEKEHDDCISSHRFHILNGEKTKILNEYLWSYFTSQEGHFLLNENSPGSAGRNRPLNIIKLLKEEIPVPEMDIQIEIQKMVIETKIYEKYAKRRTELLKEYKQSLISSVVTGKVKVLENMI